MQAVERQHLFVWPLLGQVTEELALVFVPLDGVEELVLLMLLLVVVFMVVVVVLVDVIALGDLLLLLLIFV